MAGPVQVVASLNPHAAAAILEAPMVEIENLALWYGDKQALKDVSMSVPKHRVTAYIVEKVAELAVAADEGGEEPEEVEQESDHEPRVWPACGS